MRLYQHQSEAINFTIAKNGCSAIYHSPGLGKTITTLNIYEYYRNLLPALKLLVICPLSLINAAWRADNEKHGKFSFCDYKKLDPKADIVAVNYETFISNKHYNDIIQMVRSGLFMCAIDESSRLKNHSSKTTKLLVSIAPLFQYRVILSGTPAPNSELEYWGQMNFIKPGLLETSFFHFRNKYFHLGRNGQILQGQRLDRHTLQTMLMRGWDYKITDAKREQMMTKIKPYCHFVKKEDALDLPEKIDEYREIELSAPERKAYNEMKSELITEIGDNIIVAQVALAKLLKLREATSGFMYDSEGNTHKLGSSKLSELGNLLDELGSQQVIIFVQFKEEISQISELLSSRNKSFATLYSGTDDRDVSICDFQDNKVQYLIAHPRSAAHGLTFCNCSTMIFYSYDFSFEAYTQAKDRIHRIGQSSACLYIHLVARNSIDSYILKVLQKKYDLQELIQEIINE